jgi:hypothetical protein
MVHEPLTQMGTNIPHCRAHGCLVCRSAVIDRNILTIMNLSLVP